MDTIFTDNTFIAMIPATLIFVIILDKITNYQVNMFSLRNWIF